MGNWSWPSQWLRANRLRERESTLHLLTVQTHPLRKQPETAPGAALVPRQLVLSALLLLRENVKLPKCEEHAVSFLSATFPHVVCPKSRLLGLGCRVTKQVGTELTASGRAYSSAC
jgi:hypothetical protein